MRFASLADRDREAARLRSLARIDALNRELRLPGIRLAELRVITRLRNAAMADYHRRFVGCP